MIPALLVTLSETKQDPALQPPNRGDRKIIVTEVYREKEQLPNDVRWHAPTAPVKCPVLPMQATEFAVFTQQAKQSRHCHMVGTEIYTVIEGKMTIEVEGTDYTLSRGDVIIVRPGAFHEVRRVEEFLCYVITINCGGRNDRYE